MLASALLTAGSAWAAPPQWPDANPAFDAKVREVAVWIPSADHDAPGILTLPKAGGRAHSYAAVLMLHGFASHKDEVGDMYLREARALAERGCRVAAYRLRRYRRQPLTVRREYLDQHARRRVGVLRLARSAPHPQIKDDQVGVLDFAWAARWHWVSSPNGPIPQHSRPGQALADGLPTGYEALYPEALANGSVVVDLGFTVVELGLDWFETFMASTPLTDARAAYHGPALAVVGELDVVVPPGTSAQFIDMLDSDDKTLHAIEGADHIFGVLAGDQTMTNEVLAVTANWFSQRLDSRHAPARQPVGQPAR